MNASTDSIIHNSAGQLLEDSTGFPLALPKVTEYLPWDRLYQHPVSLSPPSHACGHAVRHSASVPTCSVPAALALNKDSHSAHVAQRFSARDEHPPLLPALQPREIECKLSLFSSTDPHFFSPRNLTNTLCAPHLSPTYHLLVS